ncbi:MAG: hypothetical protein HKM98_07805 [Gammaproteobacteria bacterium]|nr:hypothetical protein [Gammaproteobacteria bacterium]
MIRQLCQDPVAESTEIPAGYVSRVGNCAGDDVWFLLRDLQGRKLTFMIRIHSSRVAVGRDLVYPMIHDLKGHEDGAC